MFERFIFVILFFTAVIANVAKAESSIFKSKIDLKKIISQASANADKNLRSEQHSAPTQAVLEELDNEEVALEGSTPNVGAFYQIVQFVDPACTKIASINHILPNKCFPVDDNSAMITVQNGNELSFSFYSDKSCSNFQDTYPALGHSCDADHQIARTVNKIPKTYSKRPGGWQNFFPSSAACNTNILPDAIMANYAVFNVCFDGLIINSFNRATGVVKYTEFSTTDGSCTGPGTQLEMKANCDDPKEDMVNFRSKQHLRDISK